MSRRPWPVMLATLALLAPLPMALNVPAANALTIPASDYQQVALATGGGELGEAMSLAVLPNRSVLHTARDGTLRITDVNGTTKVAAKLNVYTHDEEGLQGVAVDPNFATNRYVWLYYSPRLSTPSGDAPSSGSQSQFDQWKGHLNLSRFTLKSDDTLDLSSEKVVLEVANDRGMCCHVGGDIDFDAAGNLYLTTGDDSNPFESAGYSPLDERTDRNPQYDVQRTAANTNDLRGKLLRIKPQPDGTYTIPSGNLFPPGTAKTRPEIYAMGLRNPFRMSVDKATGVVYLGDYGPDAGSTNSNRGPQGQVEFNRIDYGWPYCTGSNSTNETYNEWNFATNSTGAKYNCSGGPTNNSFRNTGLTTLPAARPAWIRYGGDAGSPPEFGGGSESPMGGPVYRYDPNLNSSVKFPQALDGRFFAGEYGRKWIKAIEVRSDGGYGEISAFPWSGTQVMDMAFGPDGALYVLDYGTGSNNQALYRVEYIGKANRNPIAKASADKTSGAAPLTVNFSSSGSSDPEGGALSYSWAFGDGTTSTAANPSKTYNTNGTYTATLTVRDPQGLTGTASVTVNVGNTAPSVTFNSPVEGQLFSFGDTVPFQVTVSDPEDGTIDCSAVTVTYFLGHDSHAHQITSKSGCSGSIAVPVDGEHDSAANIYGVLQATYTDKGGLTTTVVRTLQPRHRQAEHFGAQQGPTLYLVFRGATGQGYLFDLDAFTLDTGTSSSPSPSPSPSPSASPSASPTPPAGGTTSIKGVPSGRCLDVNGASQTNGATVLIWDCNGQNNQKWTSTSATELRVYGNKCLDVNGGGTADGTAVIIWDCNGQNNQKWRFNSDGTITAVGANKCLDVAGSGTANGTKVQIWSCTGANNQKWTRV
ncbi:PKD domain-containing protein [Microbispora triticiradicis]|uniref:PKD domain-containing protein n=1 Tax=Microbispora triticiradicis TaxID=2200763 RepID=A0ABX9LLK0_9ACTN|nr:lectin [Microbispora triticiradicis]RGA04468.1 PKD domain-containing protein [Microbispora triticiradicis]